MVKRIQTVAYASVCRADVSPTRVVRPRGVLPFTYETKRSIRKLGLALFLLMALFGGTAWGHKVPVPHPHKYGKAVKKMYACNKGASRWTEREIKCIIWLQFGPAGQYENAVRIARCETGDTWNTRAVSYTDDHGIFQINRRWNSEGWRLGANIYDPVWNTRIAYYFWQTRGWSDWTCARLVGVS